VIVEAGSPMDNQNAGALIASCIVPDEEAGEWRIVILIANE
jgi:hypothetical protein